MNHFSDITIQKLGYYLYALIDPRDNSIFYIGKGYGNRVFEHEHEKGGNEKKHKRINDIISSGFEVKKVIILHGICDDNDSEKIAYTTEAALINMVNYICPNELTNSVSGHHAFEGAMTVEKIEKIYGAEALDVDDIKKEDKVLTVKINALFDYSINQERLMDAVRGHWKVKKNCDANYIAGVYKGVIVAIYKIDGWYSSEVLSEFYCRKEEFGNNKGRYYCTCSALEPNDPVFQRYIDKDISSILKQQNPIKYLY